MSRWHRAHLAHSGPGWAVLGQGANSLGNLALALVVATSVPAATFGAWSLGFIAYVLALGATRAAASSPLMIAVRPKGAQPASHELDGFVGVHLLIGMGWGAVVAGIGLLLGGSAAKVGPLFGVVIPAVLLQDALRYLYFTRRQPQRAAAVDLLWAVAQLLGFAALLASGTRGYLWPSLIWGGAALAAALPGLVRERVRPTARRTAQFLSGHKQLLRPLAADYAVVAVASQTLPFVVAAVAGLTATAGLRAGQMLLGVLNVVVLGLTPIVTVEAARSARDSPHLLARLVLRWSTGLAAVAGLYGTGLILLPDRAGRALLGATWPEAHAVLVPLVLAAALQSTVSGTQIALQAALRLHAALALRVQTALPMLTLGVLGAVSWGVVGAAWGLVVGSAWGAVHSVRCLRRDRLPSDRLAAVAAAVPGPRADQQTAQHYRDQAGQL